MNTTHLAFLRLIIDNDGFMPAAKVAGVSQPAMTQAMQALEKELGFPLFERVGRRKLPTPRAHLLARAGIDLRASLGELSKLTTRARTCVVEETALRIGMAPAAGLMYGPVLLDWLQANSAGTALRIATGPAVSMLESLERHSLDMVIAPRPRRYQRPDLNRELMYVSHPMVYARSGNPMARATTLKEIASARWVVTGTAGTPGNVIEEAFRVRRWAPPRISVQCSDYAMLTRLVARSDLLGVVSHEALIPDPSAQGLRVLKIVEGLPHYEVCLFWSSTSPWLRLPGSAQLIDALLSCGDGSAL